MKTPLYVFVIAVIIALAIVNWISWMMGGAARLKTEGLVSFGFLLGMLAMYIALHIYRWK